MPTAELSAVLFDWDGTLVDSAAASYRCYVRLFAHFGIGFDEGCFERSYSPNWQRTYVAMGLAREHWAEADQLWLRLYDEEQSQLLPGALPLLQGLEARGLVLGLVTSGDRSRVEAELSTHAVARFFRAAVCGGEVPNRKPHPEALLKALEELSVRPENSAYVGDSPEDVEMARSAGVYSVGVPGGFPNTAALIGSQPELLARDLAEVAEQLPDRFVAPS